MPHTPSSPPGRRPVGLAEIVLGWLGTAVIGTTLFGVRVWAWLTRTAYYKD